MDDYEALYSELKKYPSGPLFKVLDILHEGDEREGFDPYLQEDRPSLLGEVSYGKSKWKILFGAAVTAAGFYGCIKLLSSGSDWKEDERERFVNTILLPAFLIRERPVDIRTINRSISMLSIVSGEIEVHRSDLKKELNALTLFQ